MAWETHKSFGRSRSPKSAEAEGLLGCLTTRGQHYLTHASYNRPLVAREALNLMGFDPNLDLHGVGETDMFTIVGNTICVPVMAVFWTTILMNTSFHESSPHADAQRMQELPYREHIELKSYMLPTTTYDCVFRHFCVKKQKTSLRPSKSSKASSLKRVKPPSKAKLKRESRAKPLAVTQPHERRRLRKKTRLCDCWVGYAGSPTVPTSPMDSSSVDSEDVD